MGLQDHEARELAEIEQYLIQEDPRLAARLADGTPGWLPLSDPARFILSVLASYMIGLLTLIAGVSVSSGLLILLGAVVTASYPVGVATRGWRDRKPDLSQPDHQNTPPA